MRSGWLKRNPKPMCEVRSRFDRCGQAVGGGRSHPPGEKGYYFLAAVGAPL